MPSFFCSLLRVFIAASIFWCHAFATFIPFTRMHDPQFDNNDMTETEFNRIIDKSLNLYQDMAAKFKGRLAAYKYWRSLNINASSRQENGIWSIWLYGGLARHPMMNSDTFTLVVCHELGHHFGGMPYKPDSMATNWGSIEGQADIFSTQHCARRMWQSETEINSTFRTKSECME